MLTAPLPPIAAVAAALALGAATGYLSGPLLRRLPASRSAATAACDTTSPTGVSTPAEPVGHLDTGGTGPIDDEDVPPDYAALATGRFAVTCGAVAASGCLLVLVLAPWPWLPLWLVWSTVFAVLVSVDAATTWLPLGLTRLTWAAGATALGLAAVSALAAGPITPADLGRTLLGAAAAGTMYALLWRVGRGLGFGDVRISPLLGALGASLSWTGWWLAMVAGPLLGALWGIARTATGRRGPYAYGPWMWLGPAAALVAQATGPVGS